MVTTDSPSPAVPGHQPLMHTPSGPQHPSRAMAIYLCRGRLPGHAILPPFSCPNPRRPLGCISGSPWRSVARRSGLSESCSSKHSAHAHISQRSFSACELQGLRAETDTEEVSALMELTFPGRWDEETNRKRPDSGQDVRRTEA